MINFVFLAFFAQRHKACFNVSADELVVKLLLKVFLSSPSVQTVSCMRCMTSCHVTLKNYEFCLDNAFERMKTAAIVNRILILQYSIEEPLQG